MAGPGGSWGHRGTQAGAEHQATALVKALALGWADSLSDHRTGALCRVCSKASLPRGLLLGDRHSKELALDHLSLCHFACGSRTHPPPSKPFLAALGL